MKALQMCCLISQMKSINLQVLKSQQLVQDMFVSTPLLDYSVLLPLYWMVEQRLFAMQFGK